jgi:DNA-binding transcriptional LysR family regulator
LFERKSGGYELTPAGVNVREAAERIESEVLNVDGALRGDDAQLVGPLRVTAINNMAASILMPMFADFCRAHPRVELHIQVSNTDASLSQREADVAIRLTNAPGETLIGKQIATVASTVYGSRAYLQQRRQEDKPPQWIGVECCAFHKTWTRQLCGDRLHNFISDDTLLTLSALREGLGVSVLPCFMGDGDPLLERYCDPDPAHNLGLWILLHPDLRRNARVLAFRDHMMNAVNARRALFEGRSLQD